VSGARGKLLEGPLVDDLAQGTHLEGASLVRRHLQIPMEACKIPVTPKALSCYQ